MSMALVNKVLHIIKSGTRQPQSVSFGTSLALGFDQMGRYHGGHGFVAAKV
jgi:hypothetical protein